MKNKSYRYEVIAEIAGKPQIDGIFANEADALARARYLLATAKYTGVEVLQVDERDKPKTIFEKSYGGGGKVTTLSPVDDAPMCEEVADIYRYPARATLVRACRSFCDDQCLIPTEVLHDPLMLRTLEREQVLFNALLHHIGTIQARKSRSKPDARIQFLHLCYKQLTDSAKNVAALAPFVAYFNERGPSLTLEYLERALPEAEQPRVLSYLFAQYLSLYRDWPEKLKALCELFEENPSESAIHTLDEMIAEVLDGSAPIRAVLGYAPDLATALRALVALALGQLDDRLPSTPPLMTLNHLIFVHDLPLTREVILHRVARALDSNTRLTRVGRKGDNDALTELIGSLREYGGYLGGKAMCAALTRRVKTTLSPTDEDLSFEASVEKLLAPLNSVAARIGFVLDLLGTEYGRRRATFLVGHLQQYFSAASSMREFLPSDGSASMSTATILNGFRDRLYNGGIPKDLAARFMRKLELMAQASVHPELAGPRPARLAANAYDIGNDETVDMVLSDQLLEITARPHVLLTYQGRDYIYNGGQPEFNLGRNSTCDLRVNFEGASRAHAVVTLKDDDFMLADQSKNGTHLTVDGSPPVILKRQAVALAGSGVIFLGADPSKRADSQEHLIRYRRIDP